jgi:hypothetical protein
LKPNKYQFLGIFVAFAIGNLLTQCRLRSGGRTRMVLLPVGSTSVQRVNAKTQVIAVWLPNTNVVGNDKWGDYRVSVDEIEPKTGYDLLSNVPENIQ